MTFDNFDVDDGNMDAFNALIYALRRWRKKSPRGVLLYGPTGVGKTHLAAATVNALLGDGVLAVFLRVVDMPRHDEDEVRRLSDPDEVPVLVLDDLGAEKSTERMLECLYSVVDGRLWAGAPLVVTTNFLPEDLRIHYDAAAERVGTAGYGERLYSRLRQACVFVPVGGRDRRLDV
jgi:DNA replication protein DnaC